MGIVSTTVLLIPSITDTLLELRLVTYIQFVDGLMTTPTGELPTLMFANFVLVEPSMMDTESEPRLVTYILLLNRFMSRS